MKTTKFMRPIGALLTLFALIMFVMIGCSPDNGNDDPPIVIDDPINPDPDPDTVSYYTPGETIPGDDFPYVTMPQYITSVMEVGDEIGEPVLSDVALWQGNLQLTPQRFRAQSLSGAVWRQSGWPCNKPSASWSDSNSWTDEIASSTHSFDPSGTGCLAKYSKISGNWWKWTNPNNYRFMKDGEWVQYITQTGYFEYGGFDYYRSTNAYLFGYHPQSGDELDVYLSKYRIWELEHDEHFTGPYEYDFEQIKFEGISTTTTEIKSWQVTAGIDAELAEGVIGSLSATYGETNITSETFKTEITTKKTIKYNIPAGERWRFITLRGVEKYTFTDPEGNPWELDKSVKTVYEFDQSGIGSIDNHTTTLHLIIKYPNSN